MEEYAPFVDREECPRWFNFLENDITAIGDINNSEIAILSVAYCTSQSSIVSLGRKAYWQRAWKAVVEIARCSDRKPKGSLTILSSAISDSCLPK